MWKILIIFLFLFQSFIVYTKNSHLQMGAEQMDLLIPLLKEKKVALVINQTSVIGNKHISLADTLLNLNINIKKIFAPEHGFRGHSDAGELIKDSKDQQTGIPVVSIYGKNKKPTKDQLSDIDVIVFDIQDVGTRFYTYISSLHYIMEACAENKIKLIVCDRPNPNDYIDGPVLKPGYQSFVGMHPIPLLHGLTIGELALMINGENWINQNPVNKKKVKSNYTQCDLTIIKIKGWKHGQKYHLPIKPSPNLPNDQAIKLYPSLCFFEATNISVGRGTIIPFQVLGAPDKKYGDFSFTPHSLPGWDKNPLHKDLKCYGIDLRDISFPGGLELDFFINFFNKSEEKAHFFSRPQWFDLLAGNNKLRQQILEGRSKQDIQESWEKELSEYKSIRKKYLLYEDF